MTLGRSRDRPLARARLGLLLALAVSATLPLLLLLAWSVSRVWFFPAVLPPRLTLDSWRQVAGGTLGRAALVSGALAVANGCIGCVLALPVGRAVARLRGWRRHVGAGLVFLPVAAPPIALATGLQYFVIRVGLGGVLAGVLIAHLVPTVGFLSLYFLGVFSLYDARIDEEARSLGATAAQTWRLVTVPLLRRQIAEAVALGFLVSWAQVALTLVIGGGLVHTLPLEVFAYLQAGQERFAATGALLLIVPPMLALAVARLGARRADVMPL